MDAPRTFFLIPCHFLGPFNLPINGTKVNVERCAFVFTEWDSKQQTIKLTNSYNLPNKTLLSKKIEYTDIGDCKKLLVKIFFEVSSKWTKTATYQLLSTTSNKKAIRVPSDVGGIYDLKWNFLPASLGIIYPEHKGRD